MSASNWDMCPRCNAKEADELAKAKVRLKAAYGKVEVGEYEVLKDAIAEREKQVMEDTLREDWQIGVNDFGLFYVRYSCGCTAAGCKFSYEFKHEKQLKV